MEDSVLVAMALEARGGSYSPYSKYGVGAAALADDGAGEERVFCGANVESASYPCGVCAERVAVSAAVFAGFRKIRAIAVAGTSVEICTPCGLCRQFLYEFGPGMRVLCAGSGGNFEEHSLNELLPHGFGAESMS